MRGEVISPFRDKFHYNTLYEVGAVLDFDEKRMKDLIARKLCKKIKEQEKKETPVPKDDDKEVTPKKVLEKGEETTEQVEETAKENVNEELDEKAKSEQEAAKKIAEAVKKTKKQ